MSDKHIISILSRSTLIASCQQAKQQIKKKKNGQTNIYVRLDRIGFAKHWLMPDRIDILALSLFQYKQTEENAVETNGCTYPRHTVQIDAVHQQWIRFDRYECE